MAVLQVNPTRMELSKLKKRLSTSIRGHKLLKDKRDDLMKRFLELVRENKILREEVEKQMADVYAGFAIAGAVMSPQMLEEALMLPKQKVELDVEYKNVMSVSVPQFNFSETSASESDIYSYGFVNTSGELDDSVAVLNKVLPSLLKLAQMEKSAQMLADEIEKTRRRVNALEHIQIPTLQETIKSITMKLDENERSSTTRLMKVKDMMIAQELQQRREREQQ